jgi:hypothetical protein
MPVSQHDQFIENCKKMWGDHCDFDIDYETYDHVHYYGYVKENLGDRYGQIRLATSSAMGTDGAWNEPNRMLRLLVEQNETGLPVTKEKELEIYGGPHGEHGEMLSKFMDQMEALGEKRK